MHTDEVQGNKLFAKRSKCQFAQTEVEFLGHVLTSKGLEMNQHKVRQARSIAMQQQDVTFIHLPGKASVVADALSHRLDLEANAIQLLKRK
jgi:hypothetical protein